QGDSSLDLDVEVAEQEATVLRPGAGRANHGVVALVDPFAEHPLEVEQLVVMVVVGRLIAYARVEPSAALAGVDHTVPVGNCRRLAPGGERRSALFDRDVRSKESQRLEVECEHVTLALLEDACEALDDRVTPPRDRTVLVLDLGVRRE